MKIVVDKLHHKPLLDNSNEIKIQLKAKNQIIWLKTIYRVIYQLFVR